MFCSGFFSTVPPAPLSGVNLSQWRGATIPRMRRKNAEVTGTLVTVNPGTSVADIATAIAAVPANDPMTLYFAAGTHEFNDCLLITRGNITVKGDGMESTILKSVMVSPNVKPPLMIQSPAIKNSIVSPNHGRWRPESPSTLIGTVTAAFEFGDYDLPLSSVAGLSVGDAIMAIKETTGSGNREFATLAQVTAINGNTITLSHPLAFSSSQLQSPDTISDVEVWKTTLLENVTVRDFSVAYDTTNLLAAADNAFSHPVADLKNAREQNWFPAYAAKDTRNYGDLVYGSHRAACFSGMHEPNFRNLRCKDVGSSAFWFSACLEPYGENIQVDECWNKGVAGNGYGIEYDKCYWGEWTNLNIRGCRHGVSANNLGSNGFNVFHIKYTTSNCDFHGGRDQGNIYYVERAEIEAYWLPVTSGETLTREIDYASGKFAFHPISYRLTENEAENTVLFQTVRAATGELIEGQWIDDQGQLIDATLGTSNDDTLAAKTHGATLLGGFGNDTLYSGAGDDSLDGGAGPADSTHNSDRFVFVDGSGQDTVSSFDTGYDSIQVPENVNGTGFAVAADVLAACTQVGSDVVVNLGGGNSVTIQGVSLGSLANANFRVVNEAGVVEGPNLLTSPEGQASWTKSNTTLTDGIADDSGGTTAIRLTNSGSNGKVYQTKTLTPGTTYRFTGKVKAVGSDISRYDIYLQDASGSFTIRYAVQNAALTVAAGWVSFSGDVTLPAEATTSQRVTVACTPSAGVMDVCELNFREYD